jgi:hypothetical protein
MSMVYGLSDDCSCSWLRGVRSPDSCAARWCRRTANAYRAPTREGADAMAAQGNTPGYPVPSGAGPLSGRSGVADMFASSRHRAEEKFRELLPTSPGYQPLGSDHSTEADKPRHAVSYQSRPSPAARESPPPAYAVAVSRTASVTSAGAGSSAPTGTPAVAAAARDDELIRDDGDEFDKVAFVRMNVLDIPLFDIKRKQATIRMYASSAPARADDDDSNDDDGDGCSACRYLEVAWRCSHLIGEKSDERWSHGKLPNGQELSKLPTPLEDQNKTLSSVIENLRQDLEWEQWHQIDSGSEKRFLTMDQQLGDGQVWLSWRAMGLIETKQDIDLRAYPRDTQDVVLVLRHKSDWKLQMNTCHNYCTCHLLALSPLFISA